MTANRHLIALHALLSVGTRSASALAAETTLDAKAAADELLAVGAATVADVQHEALAAARPVAGRAVAAEARIEGLTLEQQAYSRRREDKHGPFHADRFWLGNLVSLMIIAIVVVLGGALAATGFNGTEWDAVLVLLLATAIGAVSGEWAGRARDSRAEKAAAVLVAAALAAAFAVGALHEWPLILFAVDVAVTLTGAGAGFLAGRAKWVVPPLRASEQQHTVDVEIAQATPAVREASEAVAAAEAEFAVTVEQIAARVLRAVEEYIRDVDDKAIRNGVFANLTPDEIRAAARQAVAAWPRRLELASR